MRALTRTLVSVTTAVGIAAGTLGVAGTAAAAPAEQPAVSAAAVAPRAVNNLGLSSAQAKKVQRDIKANWGYKGAIDGLLGTESWKGIQRPLKKYNGYKGKIDGIVGKETVKALQRLLKARYGYTGAIDGIAGSGTKAAFKRLADRI
ncbi:MULTISPECIES: peptidoglycan-binding domain-containing protein [Streptomyces]|uniref:peptidoglycan-binding domain-containing protein n=1 Tax=Streptomyces TaxID=1883 RepID=UPI0003732D33|nr:MULTISPECIES: peptidoglycan-binding domain-containing protein [Streptomyces]ALM39405.1 a2(IV) collagen [Streptomyces sp. FR-008]KAF0792853.1 lysin [Streptomyces sp. FR-008]MDI3346242.1 peptidoglycan-binding domain-containing protein [Streptomyces sp. AJ-1]RZF08473.1 peptidoglycan-binding protein [Streptomyces albidoflavus]